MQGIPRQSRIPGVRAYVAIILAISLALSSSLGVIAQDSTPEAPPAAPEVTQPEPPADPEPAVVPDPPVVPDPDPIAEPDPPAEPAPPSDPEPEPVETELVAAEPVETEPVETEPAVTEPIVSAPVETEPVVTEPAVTEPVVTETVQAERSQTEVPATEEATSTETPEPDGTPTPEPTETPEPSPTPKPTPVVTWSQTNPVSCALADGQAAGLEYAESRTYTCEVSASVSSDLAMPDDMEIEWTLDVNFPDAYVLQFPQGSQASVIGKVPSGTATQYTIAQAWQDSGTQKLNFEIVVIRNTCAVGEQVISIQASPQIDTVASEAVVTRENGNHHPDPARLVSPVIDSEAPTVAFDGPITFESLSATSSGLESDISRGTATVVVSGAWDPCTTWTINLSGTVDVPAETPAQFRAVSINHEPISGDACDLSAPCDVIVLPESGSAATPLRYSVGLELQLHEFTPVGNFGIGITSDIHGEGTLP